MRPHESPQNHPPEFWKCGMVTQDDMGSQGVPCGGYMSSQVGFIHHPRDRDNCGANRGHGDGTIVSPALDGRDLAQIISACKIQKPYANSSCGSSCGKAVRLEKDITQTETRGTIHRPSAPRCVKDESLAVASAQKDIQTPTVLPVSPEPEPEVVNSSSTESMRDENAPSNALSPAVGASDIMFERWFNETVDDAPFPLIEWLLLEDTFVDDG